MNTTTRFSLINGRQQAASLGVAAVMTLAVMASLGSLANSYQEDAAQARADESLSTMATNTAVQQVVIVGKRAHG